MKCIKFLASAVLKNMAQVNSADPNQTATQRAVL